jgi:hypothetical protein
MDKMDIEVLEDGTIKVSTDKISMANHGGAEMLIKELVKAAGGEVDRARKSNGTYHQHDGHYHSH